MANVAAPRLTRWDFDPLRWLWRGLTSVRFALAIIGFLALATLLGVLIPQLPAEMRGNVTAETQWLAFQRDRFGVLGEPLDTLGFFEIFRSVWFVSALALLVGSVCVCTANRLPPVFRNVFLPQTRVPDEYYERGASVVSIEATDAETLAAALRKRRYSVKLERDGDATYVFADRYPWAQFATFVSHLALILFLAGGLVTLITARSQNVFVAEGESAGQPVFAASDKDHMQVYVEDTVGAFDSTGFPLDFRTHLVIYRDGQEVARGTTTVNDPLSYNGYKFHQAAYFPDGAALKVRDITTGRVVYDEVLALTSQVATPRVVVRDATGKVVLDDAIVPVDFVGDAAGTFIALPGDRHFWVGGKPQQDGSWQLVVFEVAIANGIATVINEGEQVDLGGMTLSFAGVSSIPSSIVRLPGATDDGVAELSQGPKGPLLTVGPVQGRALALSPGEPIVVGNYEYEFAGPREFAGITVRRDPGSTFIWVATGVFLLGLALTFYTPRRRLWGKIAAGRAAFRGLGGRSLAIEREIKDVAARAARGQA